MNRVDDMFSEVRSLMQKAELKNYEKTQLWNLIQESYTHNKTHYIEQWVPYLSFFPQHVKDTPLASINTLEELNIACSIAPFATFHYVIESTYTDASEFFASPLLPHISSLRTDTLEGIEHIAPTQLHNLNHLQINVDNKDILKHLNHLTQAPIIPSLTHLKVLDINNNNIGKDALVTLINSRMVQQLTTLNLSGNTLSDDVGIALLESPHLSNLKNLDILHHNISTHTLNQLTTRFPKVTHSVPDFWWY